MKIVALYSIKGGVGKTAASVNLSYLAAKCGFMSLLWDLDPQGASSYYFRIKPKLKGNIKKLITKSSTIEKNIKGTDFNMLDLLPADFALRKVDLLLNEIKKSKNVLKKTLSNSKDEYDFLFIDCPPGFTLLTENLLGVADFVLVPLIPTILSLRTYEMLSNYIRDEKLNKLKLFSFFSIVDRRKKMHKEIMADFMADRKNILHNYIPYSSAVEKMGYHKTPVELYGMNSVAAVAYRNLWEELKDLLY